MNALAKLGATVVGGLVVAAIGAAMSFYAAFAGGYAAQQVWAWYILPLGLGLPVLGWKTFWAIGAVSRLCFGTRSEDKKADDDEKWTKVSRAAVALAAPWIVLAFAWWLKP